MRHLHFGLFLPCGKSIYLFALPIVLIVVSINIHAQLNPRRPKDGPLYKADLSAGYAGKTIPNIEYIIHDIGNIRISLTNLGQIGVQLPDSLEYVLGARSDPLTGAPFIPYCESPKGSLIDYLGHTGYWVGAIVVRDTFVSTSAEEFPFVNEFWPDPAPGGGIERKSNDPFNRDYTKDAVSEQDFILKCTDTLLNSTYVKMDPEDERSHIPLKVELTQRSYAWSYGYADDFIIFDCGIKNIGSKTLKNVYIGIYSEVAIGYPLFPMVMIDTVEFSGDFCGFLKSYPASGCPGSEDTVNIAYAFNASGTPRIGPPPAGFYNKSAQGAIAIKLLKSPAEGFSYNWWISDLIADANGRISFFTDYPNFAPRKAGTESKPLRDFGRDKLYPAELNGVPRGDENKYYTMGNNEIDYDLVSLDQDHTAEGWLPVSLDVLQNDEAGGWNMTSLLSFGPFNLFPGETVPFSYAVVFADSIHKDWHDYQNYFIYSYNPRAYIQNIDLSGLVKNTRWAEWIYDNPNYDTDGDGYVGRYRVCCVDSGIEVNDNVDPPETTIVCLKEDTTFYEGDGVPDLRAAFPPPAPKLQIKTGLDDFNVGVINIRWNGYKSEYTRDIFSNKYDFEGYRVYQSLTPYDKDFVLLSSYDREDYSRWIYDRGLTRWVLESDPMTLDSLKKLYGPDIKPLNYTVDHPLVVTHNELPDTSYYFTRQDWNAADLSDTTKIHKIFPEQPFPTTLNLDSAKAYYPEELTAEGQFKYFEYEYEMRNLLPSRLYYISVTAFDYGSAGLGVGSQETKPTVNMQAAYAINTAAVAEEKDLKVIAYPNPYRADGNYRSMAGGGFEGRGQEDLPAERTRAIHFINLPHKCTIRIYSIDGDLVREIVHNYPPDSPLSGHDTWDLITRNTQAPVSGIYYFVVDSERGKQIGKLVLIL
jgi:hypothetical protein